eukprot:1787981-Amphidinium_carterae.1
MTRKSNNNNNNNNNNIKEQIKGRNAQFLKTNIPESVKVCPQNHPPTVQLPQNTFRETMKAKRN